MGDAWSLCEEAVVLDPQLLDGRLEYGLRELVVELWAALLAHGEVDAQDEVSVLVRNAPQRHEDKDDIGSLWRKVELGDSL